jgi:hypothetical protein
MKNTLYLLLTLFFFQSASVEFLEKSGQNFCTIKPLV